MFWSLQAGAPRRLSNAGFIGFIVTFHGLGKHWDLWTIPPYQSHKHMTGSNVLGPLRLGHAQVLF